MEAMAMGSGVRQTQQELNALFSGSLRSLDARNAHSIAAALRSDSVSSSILSTELFRTCTPPSLVRFSINGAPATCGIILNTSADVDRDPAATPSLSGAFCCVTREMVSTLGSRLAGGHGVDATRLSGTVASPDGPPLPASAKNEVG
ncbi:hypothetical protein TraAM80_04881 [Trypanosoma rangeli]|uniref:Uncharacterized protein n=1 Tax=Trypanosoma rangeli TaxID=5698 RepID=A0A422NH20_TRYRA|nr:uncharacterized protein TraAM80_04881 [Trypanosoma rangeli]RNF04739.1 hypothetical protein TraAM80_04881 [Trypanosoma rangeli]|eukprot:RNF04739.1 hypothetical protein TraAM80_04881 [Trypanosoma rangeli]